MPEVPRPDQRGIPGPPGASGSRSGAGDLAGALGFPGVPFAVPNCKSAKLLQQNVGSNGFFTFTGPGRIWTVVLSYTITSNSSYSLTSTRTYARIHLSPAGTTLAVVQLGVSNHNQALAGQSEPTITGLPVTQGTSLVLDVNGGNVVANLDQQASAVVLYSIP